LVYYDVIHFYDEVSYRVRLKLDSLYLLKNKADTLLLIEAKTHFNKYEMKEGLQFLEKALQYNPKNAEAMVLRCELYLKGPDYFQCVDFVHEIYNGAELDYELEKRVSNITTVLYQKLYNEGDSLLKREQAAEALQIFEILEEFCHNMPSNYCNDDYYRGILKSKSGVYESYLTIAKVALDRNNRELAALFLEYALKYHEENQEIFSEENQSKNRALIEYIENGVKGN
jgi:tetratricopeptide (TPR) repeat protein